jgi:hypothetical protein
MSKDFAGAYARLHSILMKHAKGMVIANDTPTKCTVVTRATGPNGKPMYFGYINIGKSGVSYHVVPLYFNPKLQARVPKELLARQKGKTCFNFQKPDEALFKKMDELTGAGRDHFERAGFLEEVTISQEMMNAALRASGESPKKIAKVRKAKGKAAAAKRSKTIKKKAASRAARK